jgi:hypothetical protein
VLHTTAWRRCLHAHSYHVGTALVVRLFSVRYRLPSLAFSAPWSACFWLETSRRSRFLLLARHVCPVTTASSHGRRLWTLSSSRHHDLYAIIAAACACLSVSCDPASWTRARAAGHRRKSTRLALACSRSLPPSLPPSLSPSLPPSLPPSLSPCSHPPFPQVSAATRRACASLLRSRRCAYRHLHARVAADIAP